METKISKIEDFLVSLENKELTETQMSSLLRNGPPGANNCSGGNCAAGCGANNNFCANFVKGCSDVPGKPGQQ